MVQPDSNGFYHPASEKDIIDLIQYAGPNNLQVRVRGAAQSVSSSVFTDGYSPSDTDRLTTKNINILLDKMRQVSINETDKQVSVQAGCNLGYDPYDPTGASTATNGLFYQLQQKGLAIPNVTDAIHQTVGGFMSTGSSGGSTAHSFYECILSIRMIDGKGNIHTFKKPEPDNPEDPFYAAGVTMGLLGIITEVTLQCVSAFNIIGQQNIDPAATASVVNIFGQGNDQTPDIQQFLANTEFTRLLWWPFPTVNRLITWQARTMLPSDYNSLTGPVNDFKPKPYKDVFSTSMGNKTLSEGMADAFSTLVGTWPQPLIDLLGNSPLTTDLEDVVDFIWPYMLPSLLNLYFPCDDGKQPQQFWDIWCNGLAMDTFEYSNRLFPAQRTEFWISLDNAVQAMEVLGEYYKNDYFKNSDAMNRNWTNGCYAIEIMGAKRSPFWLNPGYNQDSLRVDVFWFGNNAGNVMDYYPQFWNLFKVKKIDYRLHWGYCLPPSEDGTNASYWETQYPMWEKFMDLRSEMDPQGVFLNSYWKSQLGITG